MRNRKWARPDYPSDFAESITFNHVCAPTSNRTGADNRYHTIVTRRTGEWDATILTGDNLSAVARGMVS